MGRADRSLSSSPDSGPSKFRALFPSVQVFRDLLREARCQEAQVLVIATARNKQELNRELLTSQGTHTFDRVLEIEPPTLVS